MFTKKQLENYADVMIWGMKECRTKKFKKGDVVRVTYGRPAIELAEAIHLRLIEQGYMPVMRSLGTPTIELNYYDKASNKMLDFLAPWDVELVKNLNGSIYVYAEESKTHLKNVDPKRIARSIRSGKKLRGIMDKRIAEGLFGWTLCMWPTEEVAVEAGLTKKQYANQIIKACYLNDEDPVATWSNIQSELKRIIKWLNKLTKNTEFFHLESKNADLFVKPGEKRQWRGGSGANIPSFEIFLSPDWRGTEGHFYADQPSYRSGNYVEGVKLEFSKGGVTKATAKKGEKFLISQIKMDKGSSKVGEFSLTDKRFSKINKFMAETLFDENYGGKYGNSHIALGDSYIETYSGKENLSEDKEKRKELGFNESALHWDLVNQENKMVTAHYRSGKSKIIYENGMFTIDGE